MKRKKSLHDGNHFLVFFPALFSLMLMTTIMRTIFFFHGDCLVLNIGTVFPYCILGTLFGLSNCKSGDVIVFYSVLQCVAVWLRCVAVCCSVVAVFCSVLQCSNWALQSLIRCHRRCLCVAACCSVLQYVVLCCSLLQFVAVCCSLLQCVAVFQNWARQTSVHSDPYIVADKKKCFGRPKKMFSQTSALQQSDLGGARLLWCVAPHCRALVI